MAGVLSAFSPARFLALWQVRIRSGCEGIGPPAWLAPRLLPAGKHAGDGVTGQNKPLEASGKKREEA